MKACETKLGNNHLSTSREGGDCRICDKISQEEIIYIREKSQEDIFMPGTWY